MTKIKLNEVQHIEKYGSIDGYFNLEYYDDDNDKCYLTSLYVSEDKRKQGIGTQLVKLAEEIADSKCYSQILLKCNRTEWVYGWYKSMGYNHFQDSDFNDVWLIKNLR